MFPQSPAATAALSVASRFYSPALLNHCVRSYLWGAMYGAEFLACFEDQAQRKPGSAAAASVANNAAGRIAANPLDG
jgi:hypothetical protein